MKKTVIALILNIIIIAGVVFSLIVFFTRVGSGNMQVTGKTAFLFYTVDSNVLMAIISAITSVCRIKQLKNKSYIFPRWAEVLSYIGTGAVAMTFFIVFAFLGPLMGYKGMVAGQNLYLHLINPVCALVSFMFLETNYKIKWKETLLGLLPAFVYGTIYLINVIFTKVWPDVYRFNIGGMWYLSYPILLGVAYGLALVVRAIHNINQRANSK